MIISHTIIFQPFLESFRQMPSLILLISSLLALLALNVYAESEPQFRKPVNCANIPDGNYVYGCSRFYSICSNGHEIPMQCYSGLKLNPNNNQCDSPSNIAVCESPSGSDTLFRSKDPFSCDSQGDGTYEAGPCSPSYIQCTQGRRFDQTCPNGLVFNTNAGVCDFLSKCKKARKRVVKKKIAYTQPILEDSFSDPNAPVAPQSPSYTQYQQQQNSPSAQADPPQQQQQQPPAFTCERKPDGVYTPTGNACNSQFWKCANGVAFSYNCSSGLVYNSQNGQCDYANFVTACGGTPVDPTTAIPPPTINAPPFDCNSKPDGLHAFESCSSSYFYSCNGGMATAMQCTPGLVFDAVNNQCNYQEGCGQTTTTVRPPIQQDPMQSNLPVDGTSDYYSGNKQYSNVAYPQPYSNVGSQQQSAQQQPQVQNQPPSSQQSSSSSFNCAGRRNGYYVKQQCGPDFYSCSNGITTKITCPGDLVFDMQQANCEFQHSCGQQPPGEPTSSQSQNPSSVPQQVPATQSANQPPIDCGNRRNGYYFTQACQSSYFICSEGNAFVQSCPAGTVFEPSSAQCQHQNQCGQQSSNGSMNNTTLEPTTTPIPPATINAPAFDCTGKAPGLYALENCASSYFYSCNGGISTAMQCSPGLIFDAVNNQCDYQETCGQTTTTVQPPEQQNPMQSNMKHGTSDYYFGDKYSNVTNPQPSSAGQQQPPPQSQSAGSSSVPQQSQPQGGQQIPPPSSPQSSSSSFNCAGRRNGYYVKQQCGPDFYSCSNGITTKITCPGNLVFDMQQANCEFQHSCGQQQPISGGPSSSQSQNPSSVPQQMPAANNQNPSQSANQPQSLPIECGNRQNGYYFTQACQSSYFICSAGNAYAQSCPAGTVFEPSSAQCQHQNQCGQQQSSNGSNMNSQSNSGTSIAQQGEQEQPASESIQVPSNAAFTCMGRPNGHYFQQPCQSNWFICSGGQRVNQTCPAGLVFDPSGAQCEFASLCGKSTSNNNNGQSSSPNDSPQSPSSIDNQPSQSGQSPPCGQCPPSSSNQSPPVQPGNPMIPSPPQQNSQPASQSSSSFNCQGRRNGNYLKAQCQPAYIVCSGGFAFPHACPSGLVFDATSAQCEFPSQCNQNGNNNAQPSSSQPSNSGAGIQQPGQQQYSQIGNNQPLQQNPIVPAQPSQPQQRRSSVLPSSAKGLICTGRVDGYYYKRACSPHFFTCVGGHATQLTCPGDLVFDPSNALCQYPNVCGQPNQNNGGESPAAPPSPQPPPPQTDFNCGTKKNGYYAKKACTPHFYTCLGGIATKLTCPGTLVFDISSASCQYPDICAG